MFGFGESQDAYNQVHHEGKLSHELIAGAAGFGAMYEFEKNQRAKGETVNHGLAKELLAGFAAAEVDKLAETKGEDAWDRHKAKKQAEEQAHHLYDQQYGGRDEYSPQERPNEHLEKHHKHHGEGGGSW